MVHVISPETEQWRNVLLWPYGDAEGMRHISLVIVEEDVVFFHKGDGLRPKSWSYQRRQSLFTDSQELPLLIMVRGDEQLPGSRGSRSTRFSAGNRRRVSSDLLSLPYKEPVWILAPSVA